MKHEEDDEEEEEDKVKLSEQFFFDSSNLMYKKGFTLLKLLRERVFDMMINN
jgi:hypothetical protein